MTRPGPAGGATGAGRARRDADSDLMAADIAAAAT